MEIESVAFRDQRARNNDFHAPHGSADVHALDVLADPLNVRQSGATQLYRARLVRHVRPLRDESRAFQAREALADPSPSTAKAVRAPYVDAQRHGDGRSFSRLARQSCK